MHQYASSYPSAGSAVTFGGLAYNNPDFPHGPRPAYPLVDSSYHHQHHYQHGTHHAQYHGHSGGNINGNYHLYNDSTSATLNNDKPDNLIRQFMAGLRVSDMIMIWLIYHSFRTVYNPSNHHVNWFRIWLGSILTRHVYKKHKKRQQKQLEKRWRRNAKKQRELYERERKRQEKARKKETKRHSLFALGGGGGGGSRDIGCSGGDIADHSGAYHQASSTVQRCPTNLSQSYSSQPEIRNHHHNYNDQDGAIDPGVVEDAMFYIQSCCDYVNCDDDYKKGHINCEDTSSGGDENRNIDIIPCGAYESYATGERVISTRGHHHHHHHHNITKPQQIPPARNADNGAVPKSHLAAKATTNANLIVADSLIYHLMCLINDEQARHKPHHRHYGHPSDHKSITTRELLDMLVEEWKKYCSDPSSYRVLLRHRPHVLHTTMPGQQHHHHHNRHHYYSSSYHHNPAAVVTDTNANSGGPAEWNLVNLKYDQLVQDQYRRLCQAVDTTNGGFFSNSDHTFASEMPAEPLPSYVNIDDEAEEILLMAIRRLIWLLCEAKPPPSDFKVPLSQSPSPPSHQTTATYY
ncbi:hypothetical protein EV182_003558 [Spiromyces aspiralis]|uniref:Uncharacterized protein n=1 Tax=Spiromyces aspiralis TaxID=68401 RepID=A0ACC1HCU2_9FUNG|nr:hypothetical protein EV182_003558 [Spiromyces aspiralis]